MHGGERRAEGGGERDGVKAARWPPARRPRPPSPPQRGQPLRRLGCAAGSRAGGGGGGGGGVPPGARRKEGPLGAKPSFQPARPASSSPPAAAGPCLRCGRNRPFR